MSQRTRSFQATISAKTPQKRALAKASMSALLITSVLVFESRATISNPDSKCTKKPRHKKNGSGVVCLNGAPSTASAKFEWEATFEPRRCSAFQIRSHCQNNTRSPGAIVCACCPTGKVVFEIWCPPRVVRQQRNRAGKRIPALN